MKINILLEKWQHFLEEEILEAENGEVVTFDFDDTLVLGIYEDFVLKKIKIRREIVNKMKKYISKGYKVYIITSRSFSAEKTFDKKQISIQEFLRREKIKLDKKQIIYTNGANKKSTLLSLNSTLHFDDDPVEWAELEDAGIPVYKVKSPNENPQVPGTTDLDYSI